MINKDLFIYDWMSEFNDEISYEVLERIIDHCAEGDNIDEIVELVKEIKNEKESK